MEFIFEVKDLYLQLKLPLPDLENVPKRRVFSELLCWAKDGFVVLSSTSTSEGTEYVCVLFFYVGQSIIQRKSIFV